MTKKTNLKIKDYSVSKEEFDLIYDEKLDKYSTLPVPENLDQYYLSEDYISHTDSKKGLFGTGVLYHGPQSPFFETLGT